jgi:chromate transporter
MAQLLELFWAFFKIGGLTFGGGYVMLPLFEHEIVEVHGWLTPAEFADAVALSASAPGPIAVNVATFAGFRVGGIPGAITGAMAVVLPAFLIMLTLVLFLSHVYENPRVQGMFTALRPAVVGMVAAVVFSLGKTAIIDVKTGLMAAVAFAALVFTGINPLFVLLGAALIGFVFL